MFDAHTVTKNALALLLSEAAGRRVPPADIVSPDARAPLSSPIALRRNLDADALAKSVEGALSSPLNHALGAPLIERVQAEGGHLHLFPTSAFLTALMLRAIGEAPRPKLPLDAVDPVEKAICRMLMLARRPFRPCPEDERVRRALWLALAIAQRAPCERILRHRKLEAARALYSMAHHLPPRDRQTLYVDCSGVADCAARMLAI